VATALLIAAGTGLQAYGQITEGRMAYAEGKLKQGIHEYNMLALSREADSRREAAAMEEERIRREQDLAMGEKIAAAGAGGIVGTEGSSLDVLADTAYQFAMDRSLTLKRGLYESERLKGQAGIERVKGKWAYQYGKSLRTSAYLKAAGTILSGSFLASQAMPAGGGASDAATGAGKYGGTMGGGPTGGASRSIIM